MKIRFWGTRGSLPVAPHADAIHAKVVDAMFAASGQTFADRAAAVHYADQLDFAATHSYGGATTCVELETADEAFIICDMGSGLREFGLSALARCRDGHARSYYFFMSHFHWDHIMGFPFFAPAFDPAARIVIHSGHADAEAALRRQQEEISFPVAFDWLRANISFVTLTAGEPHRIGELKVELIEQQHSHVSFGYRFTDSAGKIVVFSTDSEHKVERMEGERDVAAFFAHADLVICDTMYSLADSVSMKEDWGHSSNIVAIDLCHAAEARQLALFHHEPTYSDDDLDRMHRESIRYEELTRQDAPLDVICAYDGLVVAV